MIPSAVGTVFEIDTALSQCRALHDSGRYAEALLIAQDCVERTGADPERQWKSLTALGNIQFADERFRPALDAHAAALNIAIARNDAVRTALSWNNIGVLFLTASEWFTAIECFSRVTEDRRLVRAWRPYLAHGNLALCHLHLDYVRQGMESVRQALRLENTELIARNPYSYVAFRLTFVQLALQGNRTAAAEIKRRAQEAIEFAARRKEQHIRLLSELIAANIEFAFGNRAASIQQMEVLRSRARAIPQVLCDVLFSLVQAEKLAGHPERVRACLNEWSLHLYPEAPADAEAKLDISGSLPAGEFLNDYLNEMGLETEKLPALPTRVLELIKGRLDEAA